MSGPTNPRQLPEYRNALVDNRELWASLLGYEALTGRRDFEHALYFREDLARATLWYVGADACEIVQHAYETMPPATLTEEFLPDEVGFVWWEKPVFGTASDSDKPIHVEAVLWLTAMLGEEGHKSLSMVSWHTFHDQLTPLGRADWVFDTDTEYRIPSHGDEAHRSVVEDRRLLACLWQLASQRKLMTSTDEPPDRATRRRLERAARPVPDVRLVNLSGPNRRGAERHTDGAPVDWSHRWVVAPYWKQQHYGPGGSLRRPVYVAEHVKGPEDKPLVVKDNVKVWNG